MIQEKDFDIAAAIARAKKLSSKGKIRALRTILIPVTAHLGSIITISFAWFMRSGSFLFRTDSLMDWTFALLILIIAYSGIRVIVSGLTAKRRFYVKRSDMVDLNVAARDKAEVSVDIVGGDLSWLQEDFSALASYKRLKASITTKVFYDKSRISSSRLQQIEQLDSIGVHLIPYPEGISSPVKCMFIDKDLEENRRLYVYSRLASASVGQPRNLDRFKWEEFDSESSALLNSVSAFLDTVNFMYKEPIRISISGANNVGKTSLAKALRDALATRFNVILYIDAFRSTGSGTTLEDNLLALVSQILDAQETESDVAIYDRTFVDTLCYLCLKTSDGARIYNLLAPKLASLLRGFSLIIDVKRRSDDYQDSTTLVTAEDRRFIRNKLDQFFETYAISKFEVILDYERFDESVQEQVVQLTDQVIAIGQERKISKL